MQRKLGTFSPESAPPHPAPAPVFCSPQLRYKEAGAKVYPGQFLRLPGPHHIKGTQVVETRRLETGVNQVEDTKTSRKKGVRRPSGVLGSVGHERREASDTRGGRTRRLGRC